MKYFIIFSRLAVGSLFIISGLIKCNDSIGFSYKLNDYFAQDVLNIEFLIPFSLIMAVMICVVEIVLGIALIFGFKPKLTTTLVLLMMLFFTWLTWYTSNCISDRDLAAQLGEEFNKNCVEDCGCFGDALKLKPIESFYKDLVLLFFAIPLFITSFRKKIKENTKKEDIIYCAISLVLLLIFNLLFTNWWFSLLFTIVLFAVVYIIKNKMKNQWLSLLAAYIISLAFTYYCLENLPIKDFRPYKVGVNLQEQMAIPEDAAKPVLEYTWTFKVNGEEKEYVTNGSYPSVEGGEYVGVETKTIDEGYIPPIQDFSIESVDEDLTSIFLEKEKLVMVSMYNIDKSEKEGLEKLKQFTDKAVEKGYTVIGLTSSSDEDKQKVKSDYSFNFDFYLCDEKVIKTIVRSNPGVVILEKGTVVNKAHWNDIEDIEL
jgi:uncharacterized membrane protein YphA (DoxX/SURF4 family)/peroxiredoxin